MKLRCHRPSLSTAFQIVGGVVPARTTKEILKNVKLTVADNKAVLIGTDSEVGIRYEIPGVEIESGGEVLLPAGRVVSILRELTDEAVNLELADDAVWIRGAHSEFRLSAEDPADYPNVPEFDEDGYYMVSAAAFREGIRRTVFSTDVESSRYALGGVQLEPGKDTLTMAATDSRRLAVYRAACKAHGVDQPQNPKPVVPSKAMSLIERSISEGDADVLIAVRTNEVLVKHGNSTIYSRLVEGRFPKYEDVIPKSSRTSIDFVVGPLHSVVRQAQIITNVDSRGVEFTFAPGTLTLTSKAADVGQSKVEMPISYDGEEITITFDPKFVAEFLRVLDQEKQITFGLNDAESAAVFRTDDAYTYVVMPLSRDR